MAAFSIQELVRATEGALVSGDLGVPVAGVSIDSRTLQVGEAFFAIVGHRLDRQDDGQRADGGRARHPR